MRGPEGWFRPSDAPDGQDPGAVNIGGPEIPVPASEFDRYSTFLQGVEPTRSPGFRQAPESLYHAFGNVWEYTCSPVPQAHHFELVSAPFEVVYLGVDWAGTTQDWSTHPVWGVGPAYSRYDVGIRCTKHPLLNQTPSPSLK